MDPRRNDAIAGACHMEPGLDRLVVAAARRRTAALAVVQSASVSTTAVDGQLGFKGGAGGTGLAEPPRGSGAGPSPADAEYPISTCSCGNGPADLGFDPARDLPTLLGVGVVMLCKLWFVDRMVWLFDDMKSHPQYRQWLY